jgi:hypothetical protein
MCKALKWFGFMKNKYIYGAFFALNLTVASSVVGDTLFDEVKDKLGDFQDGSTIK